MTTDEKIAEVERELKRFQQALAELKTARKTQGSVYSNPPKESGAARRASMDLTRALARYRRSA